MESGYRHHKLPNSLYLLLKPAFFNVGTVMHGHGSPRWGKTKL
jgi:hypothetical protein